MANEHIISLEAEPNPSDMQTVLQGLVNFNTAHVNGEEQQYLLATVRDAAGTVEGGVFAVTYLGWLHIQAIWLHEKLRGTGHGSMLMKIAEDEGLRRGCRNAFVETLSFQALPFYEKRGYKIFSKLPDMPPGGARYALTKALST